MSFEIKCLGFESLKPFGVEKKVGVYKVSERNNYQSF